MKPGPPPATGNPPHANTHVARFPVDRGVLTTGSNRTFSIPGRYIVVGPNRLTGRSMAHESGHFLRFTDSYIRNARNLGRVGSGRLEIMPDGLDLMSATRSGFVRLSHFKSLLDALTQHGR